MRGRGVSSERRQVTPGFSALEVLTRDRPRCTSLLAVSYLTKLPWQFRDSFSNSPSSLPAPAAWRPLLQSPPGGRLQARKGCVGSCTGARNVVGDRSTKP